MCPPPARSRAARAFACCSMLMVTWRMDHPGGKSEKPPASSNATGREGKGGKPPRPADSEGLGGGRYRCLLVGFHLVGLRHDVSITSALKKNLCVRHRFRRPCRCFFLCRGRRSARLFGRLTGRLGISHRSRRRYLWLPNQVRRKKLFGRCSGHHLVVLLPLRDQPIL